MNVKCCKKCEKIFETDSPGRRLCDDCTNKRKPKAFKCKVCQKEFTGIENVSYCSMECRNASWSMFKRTLKGIPKNWKKSYFRKGE